MELFLTGAVAPHVYVRAWVLCWSHSLVSTQTFRRALTASVDSCGNRVPLQWRNQLWQSLEEESGTESGIRILGACVFSYLRSPKGRGSGCRACARPLGFRVRIQKSTRIVATRSLLQTV